MGHAETVAGYVRGQPRKVKGQWNASDMLRDLIHHTLDERGWSLHEFARQIGEDRSALYRFMNGVQGEFPDGKVNLITSLCARLNISVSELFSLHPCGKPREGNAHHLVAIQVQASAPPQPPQPDVLELLGDAFSRGRLEEGYRTLYWLVKGKPPEEPPSAPAVSAPRVPEGDAR